MGSRPLAVLLVSQDRALLRCLGRFLGIFGFDVQQVADRRQVPAALAAAPPDFLILDADTSLPEALEAARGEWPRAWRDAAYVFLLARRLSAGDLRAAWEAGIDDLLSKPLVYGELLARLRVGARELELERRLREQSGVDPVTRLANSHAFAALVQKALTAAETGVSVAAVLVELDFFRRAVRAGGSPADEPLLRAAADRLRELCVDAGGLASWGDGRFAALLLRMSEREATAWAERLCAAFAETDLADGERTVRFTLSAGVAAGEGGTVAAADDLLQDAAEALPAANASGGNCAVGHSALEGHSKAWADFAAADKLFERTVARDVMTPFPATLPADVSLDLAAELLRRSRLGALPVVDESGRLLALVVDQGRRDAGQPEDGLPAVTACETVRRVLSSDVATYDEDTAFGRLREFFAHDPRLPIVITRRGRPTGFITPENLAALGRKLTESSFAPSTPYSPGADYLVVPDLAPAAEG